MAGISTKAIKSRIRSMESTRQITKAMELVASSKLRGAHERALNNRKYFETLFKAMGQIAAATPAFETAFIERGKGRPAYVIVAGDRGLAGGYNNNIFRMAQSILPADAVVFPIGKRCLEYFRHKSWPVEAESFSNTQEMTPGSCYTLASILAEGFLEGRYSDVHILYTRIDSLLSQTPTLKSVLPLKDLPMEESELHSQMLFESGGEGMFNQIVPEYMGGLFYSAVKESYASEQAARRAAMDAASKNADEMIDQLNLQFNRARQAAITQEITEIVAGSEN